MFPVNKKTCTKRETKPSSTTSLHLTKDMFDVIQNSVYLRSVYQSSVYELSLYAPLIGVCVLFLGVCHREGRRRLSTANNTEYIGVSFSLKWGDISILKKIIVFNSF